MTGKVGQALSPVQKFKAALSTATSSLAANPVARTILSSALEST
jgi:hypothetical protein